MHLAREAGAPMETPGRLTAVAGRGIEGDRYFKGEGTFSAPSLSEDELRRQLTLFESEVLETIRRDHNIELNGEECRMNLVTEGVPLGHLVDQVFMVGDVTLRGLMINEPCARLEEVTGKRVSRSLVHRCGLFAEVLSDGVISPGDVVEPA